MRGLLSFIPRIFKSIKGGFAWIGVQIGALFELVFGASSLLIKIVFIFQAIVSLISFAISAVLVWRNIDTVIDIMRGVYEGNSTWLDKLANIFSSYPAFNEVILDIDSAMSSTAGANYFNPTLTLTGIITTFGIGDAFNTIITCAIQGIGFVISMRLFIWSIGRIKLSVTKPLA